MQKKFEKIMDIGQQMIICGAEVHRVEESIERMCSALGFMRTDVFIITSSMVVTAHTPERTYTQTRRVKSSGMDIERIHKLNDLSRKICDHRISEDEILAEMEKINSSKRPTELLKCIAYLLIPGMFTVFFGGGFIESVCSALIGLILYIITHFLEKAFINNIFIKFVGSFFVTLGAYLLMKYGVINIMDKVIIGNIMLLIPGVAFTNASRDLLIGDSLTGVIRFVEVILMALAIAGGYFLLLFFVGGVNI